MKEWRSEWGEMCLVIPARLARRRTIRVAPCRSRRRPERLSSRAPELLHLPGPQLDVGPLDLEGPQTPGVAPPEPGAQVTGVGDSGRGPVAGQEGADGETGVIEERGGGTDEFGVGGGLRHGCLLRQWLSEKACADRTRPSRAAPEGERQPVEIATPWRAAI